MKTTITADDLDEHWEIEFSPEEATTIHALSQVDPGLCESATIGHNGYEWFIFWQERHPEIGLYDDYFPKDESFPVSEPKYAVRSEERLREWNELRERLPSEYYFENISRREAFAAIARLWLPDEFHSDAGV